MKKKIVVLGFVVLCLGLFLVNQTQAITYDDLKKQLKYRLAESSPDFSDDDLGVCIIMGRIAILAHGLASGRNYVYYPSGELTPVDSGQQFIKLHNVQGPGGSLDVMFVDAVIKVSGGENRSLLQTTIKDVGHKSLNTDVPLSFYYFFRSGDSTNIYIFPASTQPETLRILVYRCGFSEVDITENPVFEESWLDYALFIAYLRIENYQAAAQAYNSYAQGIAILREEIINTQPDITVIPKIIK